MKGRYVVRITPSDVGERVSVRTMLGDPAPNGPRTTDVLGYLLAWEADVLVIERRDGARVRVRADDLVAGRVVGPPPSRRRRPPPEG